jgi:hypothetical protein
MKKRLKLCSFVLGTIMLGLGVANPKHRPDNQDVFGTGTTLIIVGVTGKSPKGDEDE